MKGPGIRLDLDVRREWECPECKKRRRVGGETVSVRCRCTREGVQMKLVETQRQTRSFAEVIERVQQASEAKQKQQKPSGRKPDESATTESSTAADKPVESTSNGDDSPQQGADTSDGAEGEHGANEEK